jgi:uncharacterized sulfatase
VRGTPYVRPTLLKPLAGGDLAWGATDNSDDKEADGHTALRIVQLLEQKRDTPFFIAVGFQKPHLSFVAPRKYFDLYPPDQIRLPREQGEPADDTNDIPLATLNKPGGWRSQMSDSERRQAIAAYYACVSFIDAQTGIVLDAVDRLGLAGNTVVIFVSDHGFHLGEHGGLWQKQTLFEEVARVPLIVAAPGKSAGVVTSHPVELLDLYPTLAELCGLAPPPGMHGKSFTTLLKDTDCPWPEVAFTQVFRSGVMGHAVNNERYRYTEWGNEQTAELYDHAVDPREYTNLINDPASTQTLREMRQLLHQNWP